MEGQWIGEYQGVNGFEVNGKLMVNIEEVDGLYTVIAYVNPLNKNIPSSIAYSAVDKNNLNQLFDTEIYPIDPTTGLQSEWEKIKHHYASDIIHVNKAKIKINVQNNKLNLRVQHETYGEFLVSTIERPNIQDKSKILGKILSWKEFKEKISELNHSMYLFRGQEEPWKLQTSFHRNGRYRIDRFLTEDIIQLHRKLSSITNHYFDLSNPEQNGAFFNLLQHHGYPTPLLDWSHSPYVAAFFAFKDLKKGINLENEYVRIYLFNNKNWQNAYPQIYNLNPTTPHLSVMEFISINNPRLVPQQALTTITNIVDIESYILEKEQECNLEFIDAFDIPKKFRDEAIKDLKFMGITAGSMFPGIDGICQEVREINF